MVMRNTRRFVVWHRARALVADLYAATSRFPTSERYGLTSQIRRAGVSIVANIAEGSGRGTDGELGRFLRIAQGSASEVESLLIIAEDLTILDSATASRLSDSVNEVRRMLTALVLKLARDQSGSG
jgi:four helix bundle protein